jgi:phosphoribosylformimino-5-aminoimidazole carboxamide ribotide isomerase
MRVILGTVAVRQPQIVEEALRRFGAAKIAVGIDARDGYVAIHGWQDTSGIEATVLAAQMRSIGVEWIVYTDIRRDGMLTGVNVEATVQLARAFGGRVIASGGVASLDDIRALLMHQAEGIEGVIVGIALYRGAIQLSQALQLVRGA